MSTEDMRAANWRKSSYSNSTGGACVEVADGVVGQVPVRDSKMGSEQVLVFLEEPWSAFLEVLKLP